MIGKLRGTLDQIGDDFAIVDVGGVGYVVQCSSRTLDTLPKAGEAVTFSIETQVREDAIRLYGFKSNAERDWFRLLQTVQGVGAKVALAILSLLSPGELGTAIGLQDKAALGRASGVGPKLAARIAAELKDRGPALMAVDPVASRLAADDTALPVPKAAGEAISALVNLGYGRPQAATAVAASLKALGDAAETAALIRRGLKELAG